MTLTSAQYFYPNTMGRMLLMATADELGSESLADVLRFVDLDHLITTLPAANGERGFAFSLVSRTMEGIERCYGALAGRGVALRVGRATFKYGLREFGPLVGVGDVAFRLLPLEAKIETGAQMFSEVFNRYTDQRVRVESRDDKVLWHIDRCPVCWGRRAEQPVCHLAVGVLQEALYWVSGGKFFHVEETHCIAQGDSTCTIEINKEPLG